VARRAGQARAAGMVYKNKYVGYLGKDGPKKKKKRFGM
jgi:hypothetical protein